MYTQECILRNPNMQDVRQILQLGYNSFVDPKDTSRFDIKKNLYIKNGYWKFTDEEYPKAVDCKGNRYAFKILASVSDKN